MTIDGGSLTVATGDDAVHAEADFTLAGGTLNVTSSYEGLESAKIHITGGSATVTTSDDGINGTSGAAQSGGGMNSVQTGVEVDMSGGTVVLDTGGDGLDSNGIATITGGTMIVSGPTDNGNGALDVNGTFLVNGGTLIAVGSSGMMVAPATTSTQKWVAATFTAQKAGVVQIVSGQTVLATFSSTKAFASIVYSSAELTGTAYDVYVNGQATGTATGPYSTGGSLTGATKVTTVNVDTAAAGSMGGKR